MQRQSALLTAGQCLAAVLFRPGRGQQLQLTRSDEWQGRVAAAIIDLGDGPGCCGASLCGLAKPIQQAGNPRDEGAYLASGP